MFVDQSKSRLDAREKLSDIAHNLERWIDVIVLRTFRHETIEGMAKHASVPVINALSDLEHPMPGACRLLHAARTVWRSEENLLAYVGDGNNVAHSLLLTCACLGSSIRIATPKGYTCNAQIVADARKIAKQTGAQIGISHRSACCGRGRRCGLHRRLGQHGPGARSRHKRAEIFQPYQVNRRTHGGSRAARGFHALPSGTPRRGSHRRGDGRRQSVIFEQAENRLHVQKSILYLLLGGGVRLPVRSAHA